MIREKWFVKYWRPAAAWVYLSICLFDFVLMPVWHLRSQVSFDHIWELSMKLRPEDQLQAVVQLTRRTSWQPITLGDGSFFHISFGAILGVAAWTRGRVQEARVKSGTEFYEETYSEPVVPVSRQTSVDMTANHTNSSAQPTPRPPVRSNTST